MSDDADLLRRAQAWTAEGLGVALATVVSTWGSAPRRAGSLLAANARGEFAGSVSGGCVEAEVIREALRAIADGEARVLAFGVPDERAFAVGLACGGTIRVHVQRLGADAPLAPLLSAIAARRPVVLATDLARGGLRLLDPLAADAAAPAELAAAARAFAERDEAGTVDVTGGAWFLRPFQPAIRVVVCGAVHVAQPLVPMIRLAGWDAVLIDPRPAFATGERFPGARIVCAWPGEALAEIGLDRRAAVVTLTHDPKLDDPALAAALRSEAFYVGALGSRKTQAARAERLRAMGLADAEVARIHAPVGLPIGARSAAEIAVSIVAEIVAALRAPRRA
ncbi:MAG TPA: XdhC/CoxI family protein [Anaeromyxobacter sp.]|nr:XdhC/CoxI family protein [Anaeromyxobacter sp.]